jgi:hypothetical protein
MNPRWIPSLKARSLARTVFVSPLRVLAPSHHPRFASSRSLWRWHARSLRGCGDDSLVSPPPRTRSCLPSRQPLAASRYRTARPFFVSAIAAGATFAHC